MSLRRTLAAALLCALPLSHASAAGESSAPTVRWVLPWKAGTTLRYVAEDLETSNLRQPERTRTTSTATVRIKEARKNGFVQAWSWKDTRFVVEEGDKSREAVMQAVAAGLQDVTLEVELDADGNYARLRNLAQITPRLREAMRPIVLLGLDENLAKIADAAKREEARKSGTAQVDAFLERMLAPAVLETMLTRNIQWYNGFVGVDIEPDQNYEAKVELPSPTGGAPIPVTITSLSVDEEDPDDLYVAFEQKLDRANAGAAVAAIVEGLLGEKVPEKQKKKLELSVVDEGLFIVHRPTGIVEMFESTRTVQAGEKTKVERHRLRLVNGGHDHVWRDEQDEAAGE